MSSLQFFQFVLAFRPFSRSQVMRFRTMKNFEAASYIETELYQSPHIYTVISLFGLITHLFKKDFESVDYQNAYGRIVMIV